MQSASAWHYTLYFVENFTGQQRSLTIGASPNSKPIRDRPAY